MSAHDRCCPLDSPALECPVCDAIAAARGEEKRSFAEGWRLNLPRIEARNWLDGYRAATNGRGIPDWVEHNTVPLRRSPQ